jgi:hypothetical protein
MDTPMQKFWLWQIGNLYDLGSEDLDGRSKEAIWESLRTHNPLLKGPEEYRLFRGQEEVSWENLPILDLVIVPKVIPSGFRGTEFKIVDRPRVIRPSEVGPLTQMTYQIFTVDKTPVGDPVEISAPNEITLAQLVTYFILPSGIQLDVGSVFYWNLQEIGEKPNRRLEEIPQTIPPGFNLRVKCSSLREASTKKMAHAKFGAAHMTFAMAPNAILGRLKERVADWMRQSGQGSDWTIEGPDNEEVDFEWEYEVTPVVREAPVRIYLKQTELEVMPSLSWINLSDQLVKKPGLVKGTLLRIYPVDGRVDNQDDEDHSYTFDWVEGKQY